MVHKKSISEEGLFFFVPDGVWSPWTSWSDSATRFCYPAGKLFASEQVRRRSCGVHDGGRQTCMAGQEEAQRREGSWKQECQSKRGPERELGYLKTLLQLPKVLTALTKCPMPWVLIYSKSR